MRAVHVSVSARRAFALSVCLGLGVGCGRGAVPAQAPPVASSQLLPQRASDQSVRPPPSPCDGLDGVSTMETPLILEADCDPGAIGCSVQLPLTIRNCTSEPLVLREIELESAGEDGSTIIYEPEHGALLRGEAWVFDAMAFVGSFSMVVRYEQDGPQQTDPRPLDVTHPRRDEAIAECETCNGDWGRHGMMGVTGCLCRTTDGGTPCDDGLDCEAKCLSASGGGYECAEFVTTFGCRSYLPDGWSTQKTSGAFGRRVPRSCVD